MMAIMKKIAKLKNKMNLILILSLCKSGKIIKENSDFGIKNNNNKKKNLTKHLNLKKNLTKKKHLKNLNLKKIHLKQHLDFKKKKTLKQAKKANNNQVKVYYYDTLYFQFNNHNFNHNINY